MAIKLVHIPIILKDFQANVKCWNSYVIDKAHVIDNEKNQGVHTIMEIILSKGFRLMYFLLKAYHTRTFMIILGSILNKMK